MYENMSFSLPKRFETANSRILVLIGDKENSIIKKSLVDILESNEKCLGIIILRVGHGISLHSPKCFNELIENWLENEIISDDVIKAN